VLSAFVILPALLAFQRVLVGRFSEMMRGSVVLLILMAALLLSFSRAAWGQFVLCAVLLMWLTFVTSRSPQQRFRIITLTLVGVFVMAAFVAALLSVGKVAELFEVRASLEQSYDVGHLDASAAIPWDFNWRSISRSASGRCNSIAFSRGSAQHLPECVHDRRMARRRRLSDALLVTVFFGLRFVATPTPWRRPTRPSTSPMSGRSSRSVIIDIDHWRHYYLILGVLWGLMAASRGLPRKPARPGYRSAA
jgi:hypothetical protein